MPRLWKERSVLHLPSEWGFFVTYEEKRQYYLKHPETEEKSGRKYVVSVPKLDKRDG
jgi:hypothetical protein